MKDTGRSLPLPKHQTYVVIGEARVDAPVPRRSLDNTPFASANGLIFADYTSRQWPTQKSSFNAFNRVVDGNHSFQDFDTANRAGRRPVVFQPAKSANITAIASIAKRADGVLPERR